MTIIDKNELAKTVGHRLKELRKANKSLAQGDVADIIGVTKQAVNSYENGRRIPELPILMTLAEYYGCSMDYLFGLSDKPTREDKELSQEPFVQRFFDSTQKLSDDERERLVESFTNVTDSLTLDKVNPRRREFIKAIGELNTECAAYIEMAGDAAESIPKKTSENLTTDEIAELFAEFTNFSNRIAETCEEIKKIGIEALLHFSVKARKALSRKAITEDFLISYRNRSIPLDDSDCSLDGDKE